jgi:hypothetical protein
MACASSLDLPTPPFAAPPLVAAVTPSQVFAGDEVTIAGTMLAGPNGSSTVRFGDSRPVEARLGADGSLRLTVPDDASAGVVAVSTAGGTGMLAYEFLGLGRLRRGELVESADLRFLTVRAVPMGRGVAYLDTGRWSTLVLSRDLELHNLPAGWFADVTSRRDRTYALRVVDDERGDHCPGAVDALSWPEEPPADVEVRTRTFEWHEAGCGIPKSIAVNDDGVAGITGANWHVGVLEADGTWVPVPTSAELGTAITACGAGFVLSEHVGVDVAALVSLERGPGGWHLERGAEFGLEGAVESIACRGETVVVLGSRGELVGLRAGAEFGRFRMRAGNAAEGRVALSSDGTRAFFSQPASGRVVTVAIGERSIEPLTSVALEAPQGVDADDDGTISVAVPGGSVRLSQATGQVVEALRLEAELGAPQLRRSTVRRGDDTVLVAEVNGRNFGSIARRPARAFADGQGWIAASSFAGAKYVGVEGVAAGAHLFALDASAHQAIVRIGDLRETDDRFFAPPGRALGTPVLSSTGRDLVVPLHDLEGFDVVEFALLDAGAPLDMNPPRVLAPEGRGSALLVDHSTLAWLTDEGVALLDLEAARRSVSSGRALSRPDAAPGDTAWYDAALVRDRLTLLETTTTYPRVQVVDVERGTWVVGDQLPCLFAEEVAISPSGRHLWFTFRERESETFLSGCRFEPATGRLGSCGPAIALPGNPRGLAPTPDGESILFIDAASDRLWRVE